MFSYTPAPMRRAAAICLVFLAPLSAHAYDLRFGYQIGASQSAGTTISDNEDLLAPAVTIGPDGQMMLSRDATTGSSARLQGVQLTTAVNAALSLDLLTSSVDHAFVVGGQFSQLIPTGVPDDAQAALNQRLNTITANAQYLGRIQRPLWGAAFGGGYILTSNGRSCSAADGGVDAICPRPEINNQVGTYVITGLVHQATGTGQIQLTRRRWDLNFQTTYTLTQNGAYNLAPGPPGQQAVNIAGTNLGGFLRATTHAIAPLLVYRQRAGRSGLVTVSALSTYTVALESTDTEVTTGTVTAIIPAQPQLPTTWTNNVLAAYTHTLSQDRSIGLEAIASINMRVANDPNTQEPFLTEGPTPDTLITEVVATYSDFLPWELRINAELGMAQPWLFQAPLGVRIPINAEFVTVRGDWTPVFNLSLQRLFDPINATLSIGRNITVGALGVSAVTNEQASLALTYQPEIFGRVGQLNLGFNVNQTRGVGRELFQASTQAPCDPTLLGPGQECPLDVLVLAFNNRGIGANLAAALPLFTVGQFAGVLGATYNFNWLDPDPESVLPRRDGSVGRDPFITHTALMQLSLTFGRGPLARDGIGNRDTDELDAFSADPRSGSALVSSRLLREGAPLLDGTAGQKPGQPAPERRDSRQVYEQSKRQQAIETAAKARSDVVQGQGNVQEEEQRAQDREASEREERASKRKRTFSEWPVDQVTIPADGTTPPPEETPKED
jgi:hypothetical protein